MAGRRKISKLNLLLHGFKLSDDINIWIKQVRIKHSHDSMVYKYYWKERILEFICRDCVGFVIHSGQICNEYNIYKEIMTT